MDSVWKESGSFLKCTFVLLPSALSPFEGWLRPIRLVIPLRTHLQILSQEWVLFYQNGKTGEKSMCTALAVMVWLHEATFRRTASVLLIEGIALNRTEKLLWICCLKYVHIQIVVDTVLWLLCDYSGYAITHFCLPAVDHWALSVDTLTTLSEYILTTIT